MLVKRFLGENKMPTYLYRCENCDKEFEAFHSIKEQLTECPECHKENSPPKRLISGGNGFILNGSGWARDNYSK